MSESTSRRSFMLSGAAAAGTSPILAARAADAAPLPGRKLRIGAMGLGFISYSWSDVFEGVKEGSNRGNFDTPFLNMELTHVWDADRKAAQAYADRLGATLVDRFDDMVGKVDGIIFSNLAHVGYQHKLAKPYLEAGIPCYINRPFAYSLRDIDELLETAARHDTPIMATAKYEHYREVPALRNKLKNVGTIQLVQANAHSGDYPIHFHIQFMMLQILGFDVKRISMFCDRDVGGTFVHETLEYGGTDDQSPFLCTIDGARIADSFHIEIIGEKGIVRSEMLRGYDWEYSLLHRYAPQVIDMQRTFYGRNYEPLDQVRKKTEIFLTGYYSYLERGGAPVDVGTVPADWRVNSPNLDTSTEIPGQPG